MYSSTKLLIAGSYPWYSPHLLTTSTRHHSPPTRSPVPPIAVHTVPLPDFPR
ncbi:hypothetical protein BS50DRAFT_575205 [Corynespora cassiicola Philippines]|uniref:Uncharacterized protein n=1 Tax=Corynespora cassiicola Philippines TaxID=1448308 RepID=A0A2T2NI70_CORCC|nr:hypothetical protein BS50DRAFT_575205 [Corynespora cassiicola Philippines]